MGRKAGTMPIGVLHGEAKKIAAQRLNWFYVLFLFLILCARQSGARMLLILVSASGRR